MTLLPTPSETIATSEATSSATPQKTLSTKVPIISYGLSSGDGVGEAAGCLLWTNAYSFVLYEDGQLIRYGTNGLTEKVLSQHEIDALLNTIEATGYFGVEGTGNLREKDPIYDLVQPVEIGDGAPTKTIVIKGKRVWIEPELEPYLKKPIKLTLDLIAGYKPEGMKPYIPQQLGLWIYEPLDPTSPEYSIATPLPARWPTGLPSLAALVKSTTYNFAILDQDNLPPILGLFDKFPSSRIFTAEDGKTYVVTACPILP